MSIAETLPPKSQLHEYARPRDFMDCYSVEINNQWATETATMQEIAALCFSVDVPGRAALTRLRTLLVKPLGLKTGDGLPPETQHTELRDKQPGDRIGFFRIYSINENEIILGEDDIHQDFRVTVLRSGTTPTKLFMATCCQRHNLFGHFYLALILPFHKYGVNALLDGVAAKFAAAGNSPVPMN